MCERSARGPCEEANSAMAGSRTCDRKPDLREDGSARGNPDLREEASRREDGLQEEAKPEGKADLVCEKQIDLQEERETSLYLFRLRLIDLTRVSMIPSLFCPGASMAASSIHSQSALSIYSLLESARSLVYEKSGLRTVGPTNCQPAPSIYGLLCPFTVCSVYPSIYI